MLSAPTTDICDAVVWARTTLPWIAKEQGVLVNVEKLVVWLEHQWSLTNNDRLDLLGKRRPISNRDCKLLRADEL